MNTICTIAGLLAASGTTSQALHRPACPLAWAATLERLADAELQHGHHGAAERLAWQAAALRETGQ